jgi:hypothetical protein
VVSLLSPLSLQPCSIPLPFVIPPRISLISFIILTATFPALAISTLARGGSHGRVAELQKHRAP